jgi:hypothetical protein
VNAHPEGLKLKRGRQGLQPSVREECEQMLRVIDAQLADLEEMTTQLQRKRREWAARIEDQVVSSASEDRNRAPRGAIRSMILRELNAVPGGLDSQSLSRRVTALMPVMNPRSVARALTKMAEQGAIVNSNGTWRLRT